MFKFGHTNRPIHFMDSTLMDSAHAEEYVEMPNTHDILEGPESGLQDSELLRTWNEFILTIRMLQENWQRINASADKITCANLRLLHNNFRNNASYKTLLHDLKHNQQRPGSDYHWPVLTNADSGCSVIGINKDQTHDSNLNKLIGDFEFHSVINSLIETTPSSALFMYLIISGKLLVSRNTSEPNSNSSLSDQKTYAITSYKTGDVLMIHDEYANRIVDIRAGQKHTQIFGVYIAGKQ